MARKLRVQYPEAIYHVMNRGDRREAIFKDDMDRQCFLGTLGVNGLVPSIVVFSSFFVMFRADASIAGG